MPRKSFLSRVDSQKSIRIVGKNKDADNFIRQLNKACQVVLEVLLRRVPGFHDYKGSKGRGKKGKHTSVVRRMIAK